ncbi:AMP-dependent synthetase [Fulvitalea axinellae]|uniref:AMP-dependent synthetase n=1 Tax=Fulvitalea axinellae TaxID=1182444 RepID=A0AAU9CPJ9_9BACT|nr:AMP-dependent synthetase [Fulvitalea axinellae]
MIYKYSTLIDLFEDSVRKFGSNQLLFEKKAGRFSGTSYTQTRRLSKEFSAGLMAMGLRKGDRVAMISEARNYWIIGELGIFYAGAVSVPLSVKLEERSELRFRMEHAGCRVAIISGSQLEKVRNVREELPDLEKVIVLDDLALEEGEFSVDSVMESGRKYLAENADKLKARAKSLDSGSMATISYTSGTTSDPKGIVLTHGNYVANVIQSADIMKSISEKDRTLLVLPLDHSFSHTAGIYGVMVKGASMASPEMGPTPIDTLRNVPLNIQEFRPTFLLSVPALAKSVRYNVERGVKQQGPKVEQMFRKAMLFAYDYNKEGDNRGEGKSWMDSLKYKLYDFFVFRQVRKSLGGKLRFFIGGGALLDIELQRFFYALGIPMFQGYGLSEASPTISANRLQDHKLGSSGRLVRDLEMRICDEDGKELPVGATGEIVVKGPNVMAGYWQNEEATKKALRDGWLYTGDMGYMGHDGFLYVLGRYKSLLIGNDGEKFAPEGIEESISETSAYIKQVLVYNNQSPYTVALVVPNKESLVRKLKRMNHSIHTEAGQKAALELIQSDVDRFKKGGDMETLYPQRWLPMALAVLPEGFTEQNRFLNSTLKVRRSRVFGFYKSRIEELFEPENVNIVNPKNMHVISKL